MCLEWVEHFAEIWGRVIFLVYGIRFYVGDLLAPYEKG